MVLMIFVKELTTFLCRAEVVTQTFSNFHPPDHPSVSKQEGVDSIPAANTTSEIAGSPPSIHHPSVLPIALCHTLFTANFFTNTKNTIHTTLAGTFNTHAHAHTHTHTHTHTPHHHHHELFASGKGQECINPLPLSRSTGPLSSLKKHLDHAL